ncbi:MAG TPA: glycoside hydrolase family 57 protein [Terriglobales bacterium]|nr:glycoside hydrolase family 57 protein [Terriglobales bacterium]
MRYASRDMLRVLFLWHMHQPFYKDLVTGEYRLPWVRLHALKDYYGMVKLLEEFPRVHQNFNLVPSLMAQIEEYASGAARDPFLDVVAKPAPDLSPDERRFAIQYLFQANVANMIGRYPRYKELWTQFRGVGENPDKAMRYFQPQDYTDLQVLSQIAWFDEFFLREPDIAALVKKGRGYTAEDQQFVVKEQIELVGRVLPAYGDAARKGSIEISTSPFYHPILPLLCDSDQGRVSVPNLPLPQKRFRHPEDAEEQLRRGLDLHQRIFGVRPVGAWPSEGSVSEDVLAIGHKLGLQWMATDEGVLGRSLGQFFNRDNEGRLLDRGPEQLYTIYRYEKSGAAMHMVFRDHSLSDLVGFVYSGMPAKEAAAHLIRRLKESAQPLLRAGKDAVVPIILDGENAWEFYPESGREFLRRVYDALSRDPEIEAVTISEAIARQKSFAPLTQVVPGSWINANFNVWIGAPEDNRSWDHLSQARDFYAAAAPAAAEPQRQLAFEEVLIAEGSDWNWWYGPEHHSANDRDFDELYRKHLSNIYHALGATPPDSLAQPITAAVARPYFAPQSAHIHPRIDGQLTGYFDWIGAAMYTADRRSSAMHGKQFLLDAVYAGIDEEWLYARIDFAGGVPDGRVDLIVAIQREPAGVPPAPAGPAAAVLTSTSGRSRTRQSRAASVLADHLTARRHHLKAKAAAAAARPELRLDLVIDDHKIVSASLAAADQKGQPLPPEGFEAHLKKTFEMKIPLPALGAQPGDKLHLRFSLWRDRLPIDALPLEGSLDLQLLSDEELSSLAT